MRKNLLYIFVGLLIGVFALSAAVVFTAPCSAGSAKTACADTNTTDDACNGSCPKGQYCHVVTGDKCGCKNPSKLE